MNNIKDTEKIYAPVIIPTCNRYDLFCACIESLQKNTYATETEIFIGLDYPPSLEYEEGYQKVADYLDRGIDGFKKVNVFKREYNFGVNENYYDLVDRVGVKYDRYIVTEDDNVFSSDFLVYMNYYLELYKDDDNIFVVGGHVYPETQHTFSGKNQYAYKWHVFDAWGNGVWINKLQHCHALIGENTEQWFATTLKEQSLAYALKIPRRMKYKLMDHLLNSGNFSMHDVIYGFYQFFTNKYQICPCKTKVKNNGWDGRGLTRPMIMENNEGTFDDTPSDRMPNAGDEIVHELKKQSYPDSYTMTRFVLYYEIGYILANTLGLEATKKIMGAFETIVSKISIRNNFRKIQHKCTDRKRKQNTYSFRASYLDDLTKGLIDARLQWYENKLLEPLLEAFIQCGYDKWDIPELDTYSEDKIFYLLGTGDRYKYCALLLRHSKYNERFKMIGTDISIWEHAGAEAVLVSIMPDKVTQKKRNKELQQKYPKRLIHVTPYAGILLGLQGWQYFDVFSPKQDEVFVNAGAFQGETDMDFVKWCNGSYKKIYAFEPMKSDADICRQQYAENNISNIELIDKGIWSETGYISFSEGANQGRIDDKGTNRIETIKIDDAVSNLGEKVTFIKMDIEGAELKALQGARETILRDKPRMAICIYHKPEDLYEIPGYILSLVPEYRFKVRQYTSMNWETVLYAAVESDW